MPTRRANSRSVGARQEHVGGAVPVVADVHHPAQVVGARGRLVGTGARARGAGQQRRGEDETGQRHECAADGVRHRDLPGT